MLQKILHFSLIGFFATVLFPIGFLLYSPENFPATPFSSVRFFLADGFLILSVLGFLGWKAMSRTPWRWGHGKVTFFLFLFLLAASTSAILATDLALHLVLLVRLWEFFALYLIFLNTETNFQQKLLKVFLIVMAVQSLLAIGQFVLQHDLGLQKIGEPVLSTDMPNVAEIDMSGVKILRPYGTLPHPNLLGGLLVFGLILLTKSGFEKKWRYMLGAIFFIALILTVSRSAWLAAIFAALVFFKKFRFQTHFLILTSVTVFLFALGAYVLWWDALHGIFGDAVALRTSYMRMSYFFLQESPFGLGLGAFVLSIFPFFRFSTFDVSETWSLQPVHNIFLLGMNEIGIIGGLFFLAALIGLGILCFRQKNPPIFQSALFMTIILIGSFDHYLWTLVPGQMMLWISLALMNKKELLEGVSHSHAKMLQPS